MHMRIVLYVCYIAGKDALPDVYTRLPMGAQRPRASACIYNRQSMVACNITNMLHFLYSAL